MLLTYMVKHAINYSMNNITTKQRVQVIKGTSYVYEDNPYWDSTKQQTRHKRKYIGKLDEEGRFIPNLFYSTALELRSLQQEQPRSKSSPVGTYFGATYLLQAIAEKTGIREDLQEAFPADYQKILSLANYLAMESDSPMYRFSHWGVKHWHPYGQELGSQRISELFATLAEEARMRFFRSQKERRGEKEHLAYDTTSISSYSQLMNHVKYGYNKDGDSLPQINLALVFGQESMMPIYYRKLPGNITDVTTVRKLLLDIDYLGFRKVKLVMDRGFYSAGNLNALFQQHYKFLIAGKSKVRWIGEHIDAVRQSIQHFSCYEEEQEVYQSTTMTTWPYEEQDPQGQLLQSVPRRIYVHVYYNGQRAEEEKQSFLKDLADLKSCLQEGNCAPNQEEMRDTFFYCKTSPKRGWRVTSNEVAIQEHMKTFGYFVLLSNEIKDPSLALSIYRNKDLIEKSFGNLKNRLNMKRALVSSSESLDGKLFVQFVALMLVSYIHKVMKEHKLYKNYSMSALLDELDLIERFNYSGKQTHCSEMTKKQEYIYACFGVASPSML
jgi:transposase